MRARRIGDSRNTISGSCFFEEQVHFCTDDGRLMKFLHCMEVAVVEFVAMNLNSCIVV